MVVIAGLALAAALQLLGPVPLAPSAQSGRAAGAPQAGPVPSATPPREAAAAPSGASHPISPAPPAAAPSGGPASAAPVTAPPQQRGDIRIAPPDPALMEHPAGFAGSTMPRIAVDGRQAMKVYARPFDAADPRPRVAIVLAGAGMSAEATRTAIDTLPGPVTLAFSPYAPDIDPLLEDSRAHGHEYLVSIPMEPQGYPLNDPGPHALLTGRDPAKNERKLEWALTRVPGAVGATGALDGMRGERLAGSRDSFAMVQVTLAEHGLLYIDPRPGSAPPAHDAGRGVDMVVDDPPDRQDIDARLAALEKLAREKGTALGLAGPIRPARSMPVTAWANGLSARGVVLVPASALALPAAEQSDVSHAARTGPMSGRRCSTAPARSSSPVAPTCRTRRARRAAGSSRKAGSTPTRTRAAPCCASSRRRSAPTRLRSSASTRTGSPTICRPGLVGHALGGRYRGQRQRWFALRFTGTDAEIRLDLDPHPEFDAWRWAPLAELPRLAVGFKRPIYEILARSFARFAQTA